MNFYNEHDPLEALYGRRPMTISNQPKDTGNMNETIVRLKEAIEYAASEDVGSGEPGAILIARAGEALGMLIALTVQQYPTLENP